MKETKITFITLTFTSIILIAVFYLNSCDNGPTEPSIEPGRRDYVWTIDTLNFQNNIYFRMWGSSPEDVWLTSSGDWDKSIAHFNGEKWSVYGQPGIIVPFALLGFSSNNIFIGAENGKIWQFVAGNWKIFAEVVKDNRTDIVFNNIWGVSPSDFYAFGAYPDEKGAANNSVIVRIFNNLNTNLNTDGMKGIVGKLYKNAEDGNIYSLVYELGSGVYNDSTHIYKYENTKFHKIFSSIWNQGEEANISLIDNDVYFIFGNKIATSKDNKLHTILQIDNINFYQRIWGRNGKDIFLFMTDGLTHYNGTNIEYLLNFEKPRTQIFDAMLFEKEVFFLVYESSTNLNLIYHGKLN